MLIGKLLCSEEICCHGHCNKSVQYHQELPLSHMVAIRGFSISNFIWYSSFNCQKVPNSLLRACVSKKGYPPHHKAWQTPWLFQRCQTGVSLCMDTTLWTVVLRPGARLCTNGNSSASPLPRLLFLADTSLCHSLPLPFSHSLSFWFCLSQKLSVLFPFLPFCPKPWPVM